MIEIATIGAGGGSIAHVDAGGLLQVGPESAGSRPGPVAYGQGNTRPTLTDANVVLGRINAERPIGGKLARLDVEAAKDAIARHVAEPLGLRPDARGGGRACCQRQDGRRHPSSCPSSAGTIRVALRPFRSAAEPFMWAHSSRTWD